MPGPTIQAAILPWASSLGALATSLAPFFTLLGTLGGVWLGGHMQTQQAKAIYEKQRQDRIQDEARADEAERAHKSERKAFVAYRFARVLEAYAKKCATVASDQQTPGSPLQTVPTFEFPKDIDWEPLGPLLAVKIRDFQNTIPLVASYAQGDVLAIIDGSAEARDQARRIYGDAAVRVGRTAWSHAEELRQVAGLPQFQFVDDGWDYAEFLRDS